MYYLAWLALYAIIFMWGACIGSFLNVIAYRLPKQVSFVKGRSFCPHCGAKIKGADLIPVFSYLALGGKCRFCKTKIAFRYFGVELLMGLFLCLLYSLYGISLQGIMIFVVGCLLLCITLIDYDTMTIPNGFVLALLVPTVVLLVLEDFSLLNHVIGIFAVSLPMLLLTFFIPDCFGGGDIKLMAVCGLLLGWQNTLVAGFLALLLGGGYGAYLMLSKKQQKGHIAFGPYLAVGVMVALLWGRPLLRFYLNLFGL